MENRNATINKEKIKVKKPSLYKVIMHNDDFTTMEFVVEVLRKVFNKDLNKRLYKLPNSIRNTIAISLSAQILTLPIIIFSLAFILLS